MCVRAELMKQLQQVQRDKEKLEQKILRHTDHEVNEVGWMIVNI